MRVPEPGGGSQGARGRSVAGDNIEGALSSSPQHGDKATSPSSPGLSSALGGAGVSLTPVPGDPAGPGGPSSSRVLGSHTPPHILGRSQSVDGHPVVPSSTPQPPSPWKKAFSASSVSRGRDAWPPCRTSSALCQGDWEVRAVLGGGCQAPAHLHGHDSPFFEVLGAHRAPSLRGCREGAGLGRGLHGRDKHKLNSSGLFPAACLTAKPQARGGAGGRGDGAASCRHQWGGAAGHEPPKPVLVPLDHPSRLCPAICHYPTPQMGKPRHSPRLHVHSSLSPPNPAEPPEVHSSRMDPTFG